jgi:hypothetical protein
MLPSGSPSSSDNEEVEEGEHDIHTVREELAVAGQSLRDRCQEVEWLKEFFAAAETMLGATDEEAIDTRAAIVATHAELTGELNFFVSFAEFFSP